MVLKVLITLGILVYGGSMVHPDGSEITLMGLNAGVIVFALVFILLACAALTAYKKIPLH